MKPLTEFLQREGAEVDYYDFCAAIRRCVKDANIYLITRRGRVLGYALAEGLEDTPFDRDWLEGKVAPDELQSTVNRVADQAMIPWSTGDLIMVTPVVGADERLGSLLFVKQEGEFSEDDQIIGEFAGTAAGMLISRFMDERQEDEVAEVRAARNAINSLSYSEVMAMQRIFDELDGDEGLLVASRIADEAGITRSVIVNALRKLASANVIESRSLGMKGTYLRILNKEIRKEFQRVWNPHSRA